MSALRAAVTSLSAELRACTSNLDGEIEILPGLPDTIRTERASLACLRQFLGSSGPLESALAAFTRLGSFGVALPGRSHGVDLADDLAALGTDLDGVARATNALLPDLPTLAHAPGAFYLIEGSTLGGQLILAELERLECAPSAGATQFFGGRGMAVAPKWQSVTAALDGFGRNQPEICEDVVTGAERTPDAIPSWFAPGVRIAESHT
jgi:heme oxygenase